MKKKAGKDLECENVTLGISVHGQVKRFVSTERESSANIDCADVTINLISV